MDAALYREVLPLLDSPRKEGDTVLLSPACKSFDLFENYEERGRRFKAAVKAL